MSIKTILKEAKNKDQLVAIYTDPEDWTVFTVGSVDVLNEKYLRLKALSRHGEPCGYEIVLISDIFKVEIDNLYLRKMLALSSNLSDVFSEMQLPVSSEENLILDTLKCALDNDILVEVMGADLECCLVGFVVRLDSEIVSFQLVDEYGQNDGIASLKIDEVRNVDFNNRGSQVRRFLYKNRANS